ncbi:hypothetical protein ACYPKM_00230 [Pseudomonas aeruginosa]
MTAVNIPSLVKKLVAEKATTYGFVMESEVTPLDQILFGEHGQLPGVEPTPEAADAAHSFVNTIRIELYQRLKNEDDYRPRRLCSELVKYGINPIDLFYFSQEKFTGSDYQSIANTFMPGLSCADHNFEANEKEIEAQLDKWLQMPTVIRRVLSDGERHLTSNGAKLIAGITASRHSNWDVVFWSESGFKALKSWLKELDSFTEEYKSCVIDKLLQAAGSFSDSEYGGDQLRETVKHRLTHLCKMISRFKLPKADHGFEVHAYSLPYTLNDLGFNDLEVAELQRLVIGSGSRPLVFGFTRALFMRGRSDLAVNNLVASKLPVGEINDTVRVVLTSIASSNDKVQYRPYSDDEHPRSKQFIDEVISVFGTCGLPNPKGTRVLDGLVCHLTEAEYYIKNGYVADSGFESVNEYHFLRSSFSDSEGKETSDEYYRRWIAAASNLKAKDKMMAIVDQYFGNKSTNNKLVTAEVVKRLIAEQHIDVKHALRTKSRMDKALDIGVPTKVIFEHFKSRKNKTKIMGRAMSL